MSESPGAWVTCPRCGAEVPLARFADSDDEPAMAVAVCPACSERIDLLSG